MPHGVGIMTSWDGYQLQGTFEKGYILEPFVMIMPNGAVLEGGFEQATIFFPDGRMYVGHVKDYYPHGKGTMLYPDQRVYHGLFSRGEHSSQGIRVWSFNSYP